MKKDGTRTERKIEMKVQKSTTDAEANVMKEGGREKIVQTEN